MNRKRIKITLVNKTYKEIDMSDFTTIQDDMFSGFADIEKVELPEGVECIKRNAFEGCTSLKEVVLPSTVKTIDYEAFANCVNLVSINVPEGAEVDKTAFNNCVALKR
ncbi:MAG: leucine-rich repeat domain-containing protein [Bacteroides sp.]|nr:leucine-rich repeat domain-containing protein [Clostridia bacterium]